MNIVIVGDGKVGYTLAEQLSKEGHDITLIDRNSAALQRTVEALDVIGVVGNGASYDIQIEAGVDQSDLLVAVTSQDEVNMICCLLARKLGAKHTIARIRNTEYYRQMRLLKDELGLSLVINPEQATAQEIARLISFPFAISMGNFAKGRVSVVELRVAADSPLVGKSLAEIHRQYMVNILVCAVERGGKVYIPQGSFVVEAGDKIHVSGDQKKIADFLGRLKVAKFRVKNVMLIGGGRMGYYLARQLLATGMDVKIIESDAKRCEELSQLLPEATILHGDGTDQHLLQEEGIEHMDAIAALTGIDEENIIISLFAGRTTRAKVITKVNRSSYEPLVGSLSLDSVFYPRNICADNVVRYVRAMQNSDAYASMETLCKIVSNKVEAMEFRVTASADFCGIPLQDLHLKDGLLIGCISRGGKTIAPRGSDTIEVGDSVIVVAAHSGLRSLNDIFTTRR